MPCTGKRHAVHFLCTVDRHVACFSAHGILLPPPHDSGLPVVRWQTYARGFTRCKRHKTASPPALSGYSPAESLSECRREQPPMPRPTTPPAGKSTRRPPRGATFGASANSTHLARHTRYTATGSAFCRVERSLSPNARHTQQKAVGSGYTDAGANRKPQFPSPAPANKKPLARTSDLANGT